MSRVAINTGSVANDGTGDSLRIAGGKINDNFSELYNFLGDGTDLTPVWDKTTAGVNTSSNVGIGTTNPRFTLEVGAVGASGTSLYVNGNARVTGILTVGSSSIILDGSSNKITIGSGVTIDGNTGIISATAFYAGGSIISGGGGGSGDSYWGVVASGISTTTNVAIGTVTPTSKLTVVGNSLFSGIATFRSNLTLANLTSSSNTLRFGSNSYIDQSNNDVFTFQINSGTDGSGTDSSFVFRTTEPGVSPFPDQAYDALRVYSGGDYWNRLVRVYTNFHADNDAFVGGDLQVGAASTLIGAGSTLGSFKVGAGGTVITTTSAGFVGIGTSVPNSNLHVVGISTFNGSVYIDDQLYVSGVQITGAGGTGSVASIGEDISTRNLSVSGVSTFSGNVSFGSSALFGDSQRIILGSDNDLEIFHNGSSRAYIKNNDQILTIQSPVEIELNSPTRHYARFTESFGVVLYDNNSQIRLQTLGAGATITGTTFTNQLSVSGITTISGDGTNAYLRYGSGNAYTNFVTTYNVSQVGGVPLISADANGAALSADTTLNAAYWRIRTLPTGAEVNGTLESQQLSVSGVSTLSSNVSVGGTISVDGGVQLVTNNSTIVGTSGTVGEIKRIGGAPFFYDGSAWREFVLSSGTPVSVPADTEWDNVVFRATFDTDFTDAKFGATPSYVSSGSTIAGSPIKIGTGAFRNNGGAISGIGVSYAYRSDYDFTGSWTIEFWIYHDSAPLTFESLVSQVSSTNSSGDWTFGMYNSGSNIQWYWQNKNGIYTLINSVSNATFNTNFLDKWSHYALVREGDNGSIHFYINGTETVYTYADGVIDNDILHINGAGLGFGAAFGSGAPVIGANNWNNGYSIDAIFDDVRISCGVGTAGQRYTSIGDYLNQTFTPPTTALPTTGTLSSYVQPPGDKYGEVTLGGSPTWRGTSGVTVSQQSSGNYRVSFASTYTNANDYFVLTQPMDQGFASYVGVARSTTHVDFAVNKESDNAAVDTGSLAVQIKNHI